MDEASALQLARIQIAMWLPAKCAECKRPYASVDDFLARDPRAGKVKPLTFVDDACWDAYAAKHGLKSTAELKP